MPGKMRAALIQFFTRRHEDEEAKLSQELWELKKKKKLTSFYSLWSF